MPRALIPHQGIEISGQIVEVAQCQGGVKIIIHGPLEFLRKGLHPFNGLSDLLLQDPLSLLGS